MSEKIKALETRVIGRTIQIDYVSKGGIICDPENLPQQYIIVESVGPEVKGIEIGDIILTPRHGGQTMVYEGNVWKVFDKTEIYGLLNDKDAIESFKNQLKNEE